MQKSRILDLLEGPTIVFSSEKKPRMFELLYTGTYIYIYIYPVRIENKDDAEEEDEEGGGRVDHPNYRPSLKFHIN